MKMFEILLELSKHDTKGVNAVGKMVLIDLLNGGGATNHQFVKKKRKTNKKQTNKKTLTCNKMKYCLYIELLCQK